MTSRPALYSCCAAKQEDNCKRTLHKNFLANLATELLTHSVVVYAVLWHSLRFEVGSSIDIAAVKSHYTTEQQSRSAASPSTRSPGWAGATRRCSSAWRWCGGGGRCWRRGRSAATWSSTRSPWSTEGSSRSWFVTDSICLQRFSSRVANDYDRYQIFGLD